jgi:fructosamine-3-kinase
MDLNAEVITNVEAELKAQLGNAVQVRDAKSLSGVSINDAWALETSAGASS